MAERDSKGRLLPGHSPTFYKHKPGSKALWNPGRPKTIAGKVRDALAIAEDAMPRIIASMIRTADGQDDSPAAVRQAAREYLIDRIYGKPNQPLSGSGAFTLLVKEWQDNDKGPAEGQT